MDRKVHPTLPARDFYAPEVFELERARIFFRKWICMGREEQIPKPGDYLIRDLMGESLLLVRNDSGELRGFYNVCRHRGSQLCAEPQGHLPGVVQCPYHAWTYSLDGRLVGTPNVSESEGFRREDYPLTQFAVDTWEGFVFVNLSPEPEPLVDQLGGSGHDYERYRVGELRLGRLNGYDCAANWKIVVENYNECLHCPGVHPELCDLMPLYKRGSVVEDDGSLGNRLGPGVSTWTQSGRSGLPLLPGLTEEDRRMYWGFVVFPNLFVNLLPDHVTYEILYPLCSGRTDIAYGFLFRPEEMAKPGFDPREICEFRDRIVRQDLDVCQKAQKGVQSRAYRAGVLPPQDYFVYDFNRLYLRERDAGL